MKKENFDNVPTYFFVKENINVIALCASLITFNRQIDRQIDKCKSNSMNPHCQKIIKKSTWNQLKDEYITRKQPSKKKGKRKENTSTHQNKTRTRIVSMLQIVEVGLIKLHVITAKSSSLSNYSSTPPLTRSMML